MNERKLRKTIKEYSLKKRVLGLTALEKLKIKHLEKKFDFYKKVLNSMIDLLPFCLNNIISIIVEHNNLIYEPANIQIPRNIRVTRTVDSYCESDIPNLFRFRNKQQLKDLIREINLPEMCRLNNGIIMYGEEMLLFTIRRLIFPNRLDDLCKEFGSDNSRWSRVVNYVTTYLFNKFHHLLINSIQKWVNMYPAFANSIKQYLLSKNCNHLVNEAPIIFGFVDCTIIGTCIPGGGPIKSGKNADRLLKKFIDSSYTGYKKLHGKLIIFSINIIIVIRN